LKGVSTVARELKFRLGILGGAKTRAEFESIGADIRGVFKSVGRAADSTAASVKSFDKQVAKFQTRVRDFRQAAVGLRDGVGQIGTGVATVGRRVGIFATAIAGLSTAIFATTKASAGAADAAQEQAAAIGLTVSQYGRLKFALEQGGVDAASFSSAFVKLNKQIVAARAGSKGALTPFQQIGVRLRDAQGRALSASNIFGQIADRFAKLPNSVNKTALATQFFGKSGAKLIPTLNQGRKGIAALGDEAEKLGIVFTSQQAQIGDKFSDAANRAGQSLVGLRNQIGLTFAPTLTKAVDAFTAGIVRNRSTILATITAGWLPLKQIVLDVINIFRGRDSQVANVWLVTARDNVVAFAATVSAAFNGVVIPILERVRAVFAVVATEINRIFGTNVTGDQLAVAVVLIKLTGLFTVFSGVVSAAASTVQLFVGAMQIVVGLFPLLASAATLAGSALSTAFLAVVGPVKAVAIALAGLIGWPALIVAGVVGAGAAIFLFWDDIVAGLSRVYDFAKSVATGIAAAFSGVARVVGNVVGALSGDKGGSAGGVDIQRRARGGLINGPGTGTSDSILARLSAGEYVVRASAVKSLGADFLDALNFGGRIPAFAEGGSVGGGRPVNLSLDGSTFALSGGDDVVAALTKHARRRSLRTPVRAPSWVSK
jgi:hypothetical protein